MTLFDRDALLASIDQVIAAVRAARAARADPEQTDEARLELAQQAATSLANLSESASEENWPGADPEVLRKLQHAQQSALDQGLDEAHQQLTAAREALGGRSA